MMETPPQRPAKTALGRGLGNLLGPEAERPATVPSTVATVKSPANVTPGVGALLRGAKPASSAMLPGLGDEPATEAVPPSAVPAYPASKPSGALRLALVAGDVVLLVLVAALLLRGEGPPGLGETTLATVAVAVAAWLGCLAVRGAGHRG